jgi:hypothetical protein
MAGFLKVGAMPKYNSWFFREILTDTASVTTPPPSLTWDEVGQEKKVFIDRLLEAKGLEPKTSAAR